MKHSTALKAILVLGSAIFTMSSTKCQQQDTGRQLKKNVRIGDVSASNFLDNSGFSFSDTARSQFSGVLFERNDFYERNIYPVPEDLAGVTDQQYYNVQKLSSTQVSPALKAVAQIKAWIPTAKTQNILLNRESSCFMTRPQNFLYGKINALEASSGGSLQFGFSETVAPVIPVSAKFKMDSMRMDLSFKAVDPWTQETVAAVNSSAKKTDYSVGFGIDLGIIHIGPEFYKTTGMAEVTLKGLQNGVSDLAAKLLSLPNQEWSTRIIYSGDTQVVILGGAELGLKTGDRLKVYNETHTWIGQPCGDSSTLTGSVIVSDKSDPWIVEIQDAGTLMSSAKVLNPKENDSIESGALVRLDSFVKPPEPPKKTP